MTITPPINVNYGTVVWRVAIDIEDGVDVDDLPDYVPPTGTVTLTATTSKELNPTATPDPITILRAPIIGVIDDQGYLCTPLEDGTAGARGLKVIATDDPDLNPTGWLYNVTYTLRRAGKVISGPQPHQLDVPTGSVRDLTTAIPADAADAIGVPQAEALAALAAASAVEAAAAAQIAVDATNNLPDLVETTVEDAAEIQLAGLELAYAERITTFTSTSTASPGTSITGLSFSITGKGRAVDIEFNALQVFHSVASTPVVFMLIIAGAPFFFGIKRSPATTSGDSATFKKRIVIPDGTTWTFAVGVLGGAAGTCTVARDSTFPMSLSATSR